MDGSRIHSLLYFPSHLLLPGRNCIFINNASFHHKDNMLEQGNVVQRIASDGNHISPFATL